MKKLIAYVRPRLPWLNLPVGVLVALLQRTPALRVLATAGDYVVASPVSQMLRAAFTLGSLGALHSLAGATTFQTFVQSLSTLEYSAYNKIPLEGKVGTPLAYRFTYTVSPSFPASFRVVSGTLPSGLNFSPEPFNGVIVSPAPLILGTPIQAGTFTVFVQGVGESGIAGDPRGEPIQFVITGGIATAPAITTQPLSQTVTAGSDVTLSVVATGSPAPTYRWRFNGADIAGATEATVRFLNVPLAAAGNYSVVVTNSAGSATSANAVLTVNPLPAGSTPVIVSQPLGYTVGPGATATLSVVATGPSLRYEWRKDGAIVPGVTTAALSLPNVTLANAGSYTVLISNGAGTVTSAPANVAVAAGESRLANLSVRANLGASQTLFVGFATNGTKNLLLRGIGPRLIDFGVTGAYADPRIELYDERSVKFAENEDWNASLASAFGPVGAFPLNLGSKDAALQTSISGPRTAWLKGPDSGVVLVEVYDAGSGSVARLVNVSARNLVGTGDDILIAGFVVSGSVAKTLLIRAVGPGLTRVGVDANAVLVDPRLEIYTGNPAVKIIENDNWAPSLASVFSSVGAFSLDANSRDAALLVTLPPGAYSAQVSGVSGSTGEAIVEVYEVP